MRRAKLETTDFCRQMLEGAKAVDTLSLSINDIRAIAGALGAFTALIDLCEQLYATAYPYSTKIVEEDDA
jgi:hypothetical protein